MNTDKTSSIRIERPAPEFWFLAGPAFLSFAIASEKLFLALLIGISALLFRSLRFKRDSIAHAFANVLEWSAIYGIYLYALLPLWPRPLSDYAWSPWAGIVLCSGLAASLPQRLGWGRPIASFAAIGCLLLFRNLALFHDFYIPSVDLIEAASLVALIEIARSNRYSNPNDNKSIEFRLGLLLALFASFSFDSLWLAALLCLACIAGFLVGNHQRSKLPSGQIYSALTELEAPTTNRIRKTYAFLACLSLALASVVFLLLLRAPFWAEHVKEAPYALRSFGQKATRLAQSAQLDTSQARDFARSALNTDWIEQWNHNLREKTAEAPEPLPTPASIPETEQTHVQLPETAPPPRFEVPKIQNPFIRRDSPPSKTVRRPSEPTPSVSDIYDSAATRLPLGDLPSPVSDYNPPQKPTYASAAEQSEPDAENPPLTELQKRIAESLDLNAYLESAAGAGGLQELNLQPDSIETLLDDSPILTATIDQYSRRPQQLYLRLNYLDTVTEQEIVGSLRSDERRVDTGNSLRLPQFQRNRDGETTLTITAQGNRLRALPLPESFESLTIFGANRISYFPDPGLVEPPLSVQPFTYQLANADLAFTSERRSATPLSLDQAEKLKDLPLSSPELQYLTQLSTRIASDRSSSRQFAQRAADYFQRRHPYSFTVNIPDGKGHPVIRWLESEEPGVCSNYAAAFTLLARARGIPCRVVGGYATREYDRRERHYVVRRRHAHAWVEYLDESKRWIRFDPTPTASGAELARVQPYANKAEPESVQRLVQHQRQNLENPPQPIETTELVDSEPTLIQPKQSTAEIQEPAPPTVEEPTTSPSQDALARYDSQRQAEELPQQTDPRETSLPQATPPQHPAADPDRLSSQTIPPDPESPPPDTQPAIQEPPLPETTRPNEPAEPDPVRTPRTSNYWILLLALILVCPVLLARFAKSVVSIQRSPELKLRARAGRLLQSIDRFGEKHAASSRADWQQLRARATEQRYGPTVEPERLRELRESLSRLSKKPTQSA